MGFSGTAKDISKDDNARNAANMKTSGGDIIKRNLKQQVKKQLQYDLL